MKIRCSCGVKYEFDVTPDMRLNPVRFVCTNCGLDSSEYVNQLVREELAENSLAAIAKPQEQAAPPVEAPRLKISREAKPAEAPAADAPLPQSSKYCIKHHGALAAEKCTVCGKPICPKCMEEFGYFCSPYCQNKANQQGIAAPVYAGQKFEVQKKFWRKAGLIGGTLAGLVVLFFIVWTWYAWFGSVPHKYFAVRFEDNDRAYAGKSQLVGKDQIVFLHGGRLARYDLKDKKQVWVQELITKEDIADGVKRESESEAASNSGGGYQHHLNGEVIERYVKIGLQSSLLLRVSGENVWVAKMVELPPTQPDTFPESAYQLIHYDWATGKIMQTVTIPTSRGEMIENGDELLLLKHTEVGAQFVTHVSLTTGEQHTQEFYDPGATLALAAAGKTSPASGAAGSKPLDPKIVEAQMQNLQLPARIALPALLASTMHEKQLEAELKEGDAQKPQTARGQKRIAERFQLIPSNNGYIQFAWHLIEAKSISHEAMKAPQKKSVLNDANLNVTQTAEVANEMLNEQQRKNGGSTVTEDVSRYQVSIRRADSPDLVDWTGEVVGPPALFPLKTVNVLVAGKTAIVFDKSNKKLWEATLIYTVSGGGGFRGDESEFGAGPCVEHGDTLYIFDQAMLSAFELGNGNARWRVPSVGVVGLFFDDAGNVYVNTTSGNPDDIKYSRQIDVSKHTDDVLLKLDPKNGRTLWSIKPGGFISYLKGKFIYAVQAYDPNPTDEDVINDMAASLQKPPFLRIIRINPKNGRIMWDYYDRDRCPIDVRFNENSIELVFKREVQVLRYLTF